MHFQDKIIQLCYRFCDNIITLCMLVTVGFVAVINFIYTSSVAYVWTEDVSIGRTSWLAIVLAAALFLGFVVFRRLLDGLKEWQIFLFFTVVYLMIGTYWICNISTHLRMDADSVHAAAMALLEGDFSFLDRGEYLFLNEHQLGIVTYETFLGIISKSVRFQYVVNLLEVIGINFVSWRLTNLCFAANHGANLLVILFSFLFLPQFFFIAFAYGLIPGLFFILLSFLFLYKYFAGHGGKFLALCLLCVVLAVFLKGNNIIGAVAIAILLFLRTLRRKKLRYLLAALAVMVCAGSVGRATGLVYERVSGKELTGGRPMLLWIAMGTEPYYNNAAGWFNGYNDWVFEQADYNPEEASKMAQKTLKDTAFTFRDHPDWMLSFFGEKLISMWCDPMYESVWSGPLPDAGAEHKSEFLNELYSGRGIEPGIALYMKSFMLVMFVLAAISAMRRRNLLFDCHYIYLYFVGGFLLHVLWEAKSQYVYPYVFILLPCCAYEMAVISDKLFERLHRGGQEDLQSREDD